MAASIPQDIELVLTESRRKSIVDFHYFLNAEYQFEMKGATLHLFNEDESFNWRFEVNQHLHELFAGATMIAFSTADKLSRAISLNRDTTMFATEDGSFLVNVLLSFVDLSIVRAGGPTPNPGEGFSTLSVEVGPISELVRPQGGKNIQEVLTEFRANLLDIVSDLEDGSEYEMVLESERAVRTADDLLTASMIYTDFIHPVWNRVERSGCFDVAFLEKWKNICGTRIEEKRGACSTFFSNVLV